MLGEFRRLSNTNTENEERFVVDVKTFGALLKRVRISLRMTQDDLGKVLLLSPSTVRAWEYGRQLPSFENYNKLCVLIKDEDLREELNRAWLTEKGR